MVYKKFDGHLIVGLFCHVNSCEASSEKAIFRKFTESTIAISVMAKEKLKALTFLAILGLQVS